jgi:hypothetical protein
VPAIIDQSIILNLGSNLESFFPGKESRKQKRFLGIIVYKENTGKLTINTNIKKKINS